MKFDFLDLTRFKNSPKFLMTKESEGGLRNDEDHPLALIPSFRT